MDRPQRLPLVRWGGWYFLTIGLLLDVIGLRYMFDYPWPAQGIARFYSVIAFVSHFALLALAPWALVVLPLTLLAPRRRLVAAVSVFAAAVLLAAVLIDSLVFAEDRFHVSALALAILGWSTWGFALLYFAIFLAMCAMLARATLPRFARLSGRALVAALAGLVLVPFLATQALHVWADATYYVPITGFTPYLPLFRPWSARDTLIRMGIVSDETAHAAALAEQLGSRPTGLLNYPLAPMRCAPPARASEHPGDRPRRDAPGRRRPAHRAEHRRVRAASDPLRRTLERRQRHPRGLVLALLRHSRDLLAGVLLRAALAGADRPAAGRRLPARHLSGQSARQDRRARPDGVSQRARRRSRGDTRRREDRERLDPMAREARPREALLRLPVLRVRTRRLSGELSAGGRDPARRDRDGEAPRLLRHRDPLRRHAGGRGAEGPRAARARATTRS